MLAARIVNSAYFFRIFRFCTAFSSACAPCTGLCRGTPAIIFNICNSEGICYPEMEQTLLKRTVIFVNDAVFSNGVRIPMIGFGTYHATDELGQSVLEEALRCGYRSFDTAVLYRNEEMLGAAIEASGVPRERLFLASKVPQNDLGYDRLPQRTSGIIARSSRERGRHNRCLQRRTDRRSCRHRRTPAARGYWPRGSGRFRRS